MGHDFGAGLAWTLAFMCPDKVQHVVVLSVGYLGPLQRGPCHVSSLNNAASAMQPDSINCVQMMHCMA